MAGRRYTLLHFMEDWDVFSCFCVVVDAQVMLKTQAALLVRRSTSRLLFVSSATARIYTLCAAIAPSHGERSSASL